MTISIKRDIHAYVVYVDGKIHRTGFPTRKAAKRFSRSLAKTSTILRCDLDHNQLESLKIFNGAVENCQYCDTKIMNPIWVQRGECMYPICSECRGRYSDRFSVVIDGAGR